EPAYTVKALNKLGCRRAVLDVVRLADKVSLADQSFLRADIVGFGRHVERPDTGRIAGVVQGLPVATRQCAVVRRVDVAQHGHYRLGTHQVAATSRSFGGIRTNPAWRREVQG